MIYNQNLLLRQAKQTQENFVKKQRRLLKSHVNV